MLGFNVLRKAHDKKVAGFDFDNHAECAKAISTNASNIQYVEDPDEELQLLAATTDPSSMQYIKNPTENVKREAVQRQAGAIQYIENPTLDLMLIAIKKSPLSAIKAIKGEYQTKETNIAACKKIGKCLQFCVYQDEDVILAAVNKDGIALQFAQFQNEKIDEAACNQNGLALEFVQEKFKTTSLNAIACHNNGRALAFVSEQTPVAIYEALNNDGMVIDQVHAPTFEMERAAVLQNPEAIMLIDPCPTSLHEIAVRKDGMTLRLIPMRQRTKKICDIALEQNPLAKQFVPEKYGVEEIWANDIKIHKDQLSSVYGEMHVDSLDGDNYSAQNLENYKFQTMVDPERKFINRGYVKEV